ncbi:MAG: S41 family peptidase [Caldilineaceae bacterium]
MAARRIFFYLALLITICLAFGVGYVAYPLLNPASKPAAAAADAQLNPDPVDMHLYWEAWYILSRDFYGTKPDMTKLVYGAIRGLVAAYQDPYTVFLEPPSTEVGGVQLQGSSGDVGARVEHTEHGYLLHPAPNQPAANAGVQDGDLLLLVDDKEITPQMSEDEVNALLLGEIGSNVVLVVRRVERLPKDTVELSFHMTRKEYTKPSIRWSMVNDRRGMPSIGYIKQDLFSKRSPDEMRSAVQELLTRGAKGFVWDLRKNPGGLVEESVQLADMWLDNGLILLEQRADGSQKTFNATPGDETHNAPLVIIVDKDSASASEIVAGALQDHGRAKLVGEKTFGKGSVQLVYELSDHSSLHVTNAQWFTPNHHQISGQGLTPDVPVVPDEDPLPKAIALVDK